MVTNESRLEFTDIELACILAFIQFGLRYSPEPNPRAVKLIEGIVSKIERYVDAKESHSPIQTS